MQRFIRQRELIVLLFMTILFSFLSYPVMALPITVINPDSLSGEKERLLKGEIIVALSRLPEGVTGVEGQIFIAAPPKKVWEVLTDYNNHKYFVPNVIDSGIISDNGIEKVMFEKGKTRMFIFQKEVYIKMKVWGEHLTRLNFQQITGNFKVYQGEWILVDYLQGTGTFLTYKAEVKPDFYAPQFAVRNVQHRDCPLMMLAMKKQAESNNVKTLPSDKE
ncbi:MAG: cyclase [Chlorobiaceae bacterium]|nr:cyclase [Chlorobiaceae bacterium]NTV16739.1 cyclase [Chlorobiaceae bacterium]